MNLKMNIIVYKTIIVKTKIKYIINEGVEDDNAYKF